WLPRSDTGRRIKSRLRQLNTTNGNAILLVALADQNDVLAARVSGFHRSEHVGNFLHRNRGFDVCAQRALAHEVEQSLPYCRPVLQLKGDRALARREARNYRARYRTKQGRRIPTGVDVAAGLS